MGCDIHMHYEIKQPDGSWKPHNWKQKHATSKIYDDGSPELRYDEMFRDPLCVDRNYDLFAVLAGVRNGTGFAGIKTGETKRPIASPRGLPDDVSDEVQRDSDGWGVDGHSHSWITLAEAVGYDYSQSTVNLGVVNEVEFAEFERNGKPKSWRGGVSGRMIRRVQVEWMRAIISGAIPREEGIQYYTKVEWRESYRDMLGKRWFTTLDTLQEQFGLDNVRLVFWFDS
jgi:hypothetical protein